MTMSGVPPGKRGSQSSLVSTARPSTSTSAPKANKDRTVESRALRAVKHLIEADFERTTEEQIRVATLALQETPLVLTLGSVVGNWAERLVDVGRQRAAKIAAVLRLDRAPEACIGFILLAVSKHLRLPQDGTILDSKWPHENRVREFANAAANPSTMKLTFGRLASVHSATACALDLVEDDYVELEANFRESLFRGLKTAESESVLSHFLDSFVATPKLASDSGRRGRKPKLSPAACTAIQGMSKANPNCGTKQICLKMDQRAERDKTCSPPEQLAGKAHRLWTDYYTDERTRNAVTVLISKAKKSPHGSLS